MKLVSFAMMPCFSTGVGSDLSPIPLTWLHGRSEGGEDLLPQLGRREAAVRDRDGNAPFLGLGRQHVHAGLASVAAVAAAFVEVPDLDAVALRVAYNDGHVVGLAVAFQDTVYSINAMDV